MVTLGWFACLVGRRKFEKKIETQQRNGSIRLHETVQKMERCSQLPLI